MKRLALWVVTLALAAVPAVAGAELILQDGQVLKGESVERKGDLYLLRLATGGDTPVPFELVRQVKLTGDTASSPPAPAAKSASKPTPKPEPPKAPGGYTYTEPVTLAGTPGPIHPPELAKQLAVMRHQTSVFAPSAIDPGWQPKSDWDMDPSRNNFNPVRWAKSPIDPHWKPKPAFTTKSDRTQFNPAKWFKAPIDATWRPADGFRKSEP